MSGVRVIVHSSIVYFKPTYSKVLNKEVMNDFVLLMGVRKFHSHS